MVASLIPEFQKRNVKVIALSCDPVDSHKNWIKDIQAYNGLNDGWPYPIISDPHREIAVKLGMLDPAEKDKAGLPLTARAVREHLYVHLVKLCVYANPAESTVQYRSSCLNTIQGACTHMPF